MNAYHQLVSGILIALAGLFTFVIYSSSFSFSSRRIARVGVMLSMALVAGLVESFIPSAFIPGIRLGLANVVILFALYVFGYGEAFIIALLKAILVAILRGSFFSMGGYMALAGTMLSFLVMALLRLLLQKLSVIGVSIFGSLSHVFGQVFVAYIYVGPAIWGYLPWLLLFSFGSGILTGVLCFLLLKRRGLLAYLGKKK